MNKSPLEEDDEEENEIKLLILNSQRHLKNKSFPKLTQSFSAHANLDMLKRQFKPKQQLMESKRRWDVENEEESNLLNNVNSPKVNYNLNKCHTDNEEEDSDEEFFIEHADLRLLRKSKSAFAGFHDDRRFHTKPLLSKVLGEGVSDNEKGISELIYLNKGDILQFRIDNDNTSKCKGSEEMIGCDTLFLPDHSLAISPESQSLCKAESCWSAPAYSINIEKGFSSPGYSDNEQEEGDQEFFGNISELISEADDGSRKESSWSAPDKFNFRIIGNERDKRYDEEKYFDYCEEHENEPIPFNDRLNSHNQEVCSNFQKSRLTENLTNINEHKMNEKIEANDNKNELIPMADDDNRSIINNFSLVYGGYLPLPPGQRCHSIVENSVLDAMNSSFSSYSDDDEEDQRRDSFWFKRLARQQLVRKSAAMRLCRRGSPPFAQIDLLSESEISDLEQQIASGRLGNKNINMEAINDNNCELEKKIVEESNFYDGLQNKQSSQKLGDMKQFHQPSIIFNYSKSNEVQLPRCNTVEFQTDSKVERVNIPKRMTQSDSALLGHFSNRSISSELCKQKFNINTLHTQNKTSSIQSNCDATSKLKFDSKDSIDTLLNNRQHLSLSFTSSSIKRRQLPKTPSPEYPPGDIISTTSRERVLNVLRQTCLLLRQSQETEGRNSVLSHMNCAGSFEDHSLMKNDNKLVLPVLPSPSMLNIQPKWPQSNCRVQALEEEKQYTLSYGMDQSANVNSKRRRRLLSIEGSYYEDKLQTIMAANNPLESDFGISSTRGDAQLVNELDSLSENDNDRPKVLGYIFADGAKSSSGISTSCYTSSSRSCEFPEYEQQQRTTSRAKRLSPRLGDPNAPTHRVQFQFVPRHDDELRLDRGDALHVDEKFSDYWCFGMNLRSGQRGIFPEAHIIEIDLVDEICRSVLPETNHQINVERDIFYLTMLASVEVAHHKGNDILVQGINKVCSIYQQKDEILVPQTVLMEISFRGVHVIDKRKKDIFRCPAFDYFYSLQNISFCGAHPKELRYFGFITKHPLLPRFACHVFLSNESTQPIVEAIGRAFKRSYDEYMAFAHPTEDIFLDE